jgi:hypothetical protein
LRSGLRATCLTLLNRGAIPAFLNPVVKPMFPVRPAG